jgi:adenylate kinase family enzyme
MNQHYQAAEPIKRINVIGTSGTGKSTFGQRLADKLGAPYVSLDALYWGPNWTEPSNEVFFPRIEEALAGERWVLDGNYDKAREVKWKNVSMIVWLDYSFTRTLAQVTWRTFRRWTTREVLWSGNRESLRQTLFTKNSIIWWMMTSHKRNRIKYLELERNPPPGVQVIRLKNRKEAENFLRQF